MARGRIFLVGIFLAAGLLVTGFTLPENPPVPDKRPEAIADSVTAAEQTTPAEEPEAAGEDVPTAPPVPTERPEKPPEPARDPKPDDEGAAAFKTCTEALMALGAKFEMLDTIDDPGACGIARPLKVSAVLDGVPLKPAGTMRCETALSLSNWARSYVEPSAKIAFGRDVALTEVRQASTYVCRNRNSRADGKLSEHAKGNAVDIRSLSFSDGTTVEMLPRMKDGTKTGAFQRTVSAAACLYFTTVLSPGSDATHQDHMHLDVIKRNRGYRYCR